MSTKAQRYFEDIEKQAIHTGDYGNLKVQFEEVWLALQEFAEMKKSFNLMKEENEELRNYVTELKAKVSTKSSSNGKKK